MKKRVLSIIMCALMILTLCACGKPKEITYDNIAETKDRIISHRVYHTNYGDIDFTLEKGTFPFCNIECEFDKKWQVALGYVYLNDLLENTEYDYVGSASTKNKSIEISSDTVWNINGGYGPDFDEFISTQKKKVKKEKAQKLYDELDYCYYDFEKVIIKYIDDEKATTEESTTKKDGKELKSKYYSKDWGSINISCNLNSDNTFDFSLTIQVEEDWQVANAYTYCKYIFEQELSNCTCSVIVLSPKVSINDYMSYSLDGGLINMSEYLTEHLQDVDEETSRPFLSDIYDTLTEFVNEMSSEYSK